MVVVVVERGAVCDVRLRVNARFTGTWKRRFAVERDLRGRKRLMQYAQNAGDRDRGIEKGIRVLLKHSMNLLW